MRGDKRAGRYTYRQSECERRVGKDAEKVKDDTERERGGSQGKRVEMERWKKSIQGGQESRDRGGEAGTAVKGEEDTERWMWWRRVMTEQGVEV